MRKKRARRFAVAPDFLCGIISAARAAQAAVLFYRIPSVLLTVVPAVCRLRLPFA
jgi:hypothetical protein